VCGVLFRFGGAPGGVTQIPKVCVYLGQEGGDDMEFIWFILIGLAAGWVAGQLMKGGGFGVVGDIIVGAIGALLGGFLFRTLGVSAGVARQFDRRDNWCRRPFISIAPDQESLIQINHETELVFNPDHPQASGWLVWSRQANK
jgi:uncharacterized membrane protein YeaQ/YmgE (transglycosylase-associated protein family)